MQPTRRPSCRMGRSIDSPSPSTQKRRLFSRSALGMTGMHESTSISVSATPDAEVSAGRRPEFLRLLLFRLNELGQLFAHAFRKRQCVAGDVGLVRMLLRVVLVIGLGREELLERLERRDDRIGKS